MNSHQTKIFKLQFSNDFGCECFDGNSNYMKALENGSLDPCSSYRIIYLVNFILATMLGDSFLSASPPWTFRKFLFLIWSIRFCVSFTSCINALSSTKFFLFRLMVRCICIFFLDICCSTSCMAASFLEDSEE